MKEQENSSKEKLNEMKAVNLSEIQFRVMVLRILSSEGIRLRNSS